MHEDYSVIATGANVGYIRITGHRHHGDSLRRSLNHQKQRSISKPRYKTVLTLKPHNTHNILVPGQINSI